MSIQKRSVLYVKPKNKQFRFIGWAMVTTTLGAMLEPFDISHHNPGVNWVDYDPSDEISRIDELQNVDDGTQILLTSHGETMQTMGGDRYPSVIPVTGKFV